MRKCLLICIGLFALLLVGGVMSVFSVLEKGSVPSNISDGANIQKEKPPDNQSETVVTNVVNEPGIGELPMPVFREDVIVYFKEMPVSLEDFVSKYGGKLIFAKQEIKMVAFEPQPIGKPGETSQQTLDFINEVSKDARVEKVFKDEFLFINPDKVFTPEARIMFPAEMKDKYVPNEVIVGFWKFPPSLDEFALKYGVKLKEVENILMFARFETEDITSFLNKVSTDPYVSYAHPRGSGQYTYTPNDLTWNQS